MAEVGKKLEVSEHKIVYWMKKHNLKRRSRSEATYVKRNPKDKRSVKLTWNKSKEATGYNISYGIDKDKMYNNYLIYKDTTVTINSLNVNYNYYFSIESFNEYGITENGIVKMVD